MDKMIWYKTITWWMAAFLVIYIAPAGWAGFGVCFAFGFISSMLGWYALPFLYKRKK